MAQKNNKRTKGKRGYRLHDERIAFSGGKKSMRSIKYELQGVDKQVFIDAVIHDNRCLYGDLNFNDFASGIQTANFMDFWILALSLGFVFSKQSHAVFDFTTDQKSRGELFDRIDMIDCEKIEQAAWLYFFNIRKDTRTKISRVFLREYREDTDVQVLTKKYVALNGNANRTEERIRLFISDYIEKDEDSFPKYQGKNVAWHCYPDLEIEMTTRTKTLDGVIAAHNERFGIERNERNDETSNRMGLYSDQGYFYAVMGNFFDFIHAGDFDDYLNQVKDFFHYNDKEIDRISIKLKKLSAYAQGIPVQPALVTKWADYRIDLGGKLESWYSNRESDQDTTAKQLRERSVLLYEIHDALPDDLGIKEGILAETIRFIGNASGQIDRAFTDELQSRLAILREKLNEWAQNNKEDATELNKIKNWQKNLKQRVQASPLFFGENKRNLWEQLLNLKQLIIDEVHKLEAILELDTVDYGVTNKQVNMLARLNNRIIADGNKLVIARLQEIEKLLGVNFADRTDRATFNLTGRERGKYRDLSKDEQGNDLIKRIRISELLASAQLSELFGIMKDAPQNDYILRDGIQLSKIVLSAKIHHEDADMQHHAVLAHSILSGYANRISKTSFVSRYPVQAVNGKHNRLALNPGTGRYHYAFNKGLFPDCKHHELSVAKQGDNFDSSGFRDEPQSVPSLEVWSSRYQIQFLDWFMGKHKKKKTVLRAGGSFTIAEKEVRIDWSGEKPIAICEGKDRLFVSQPFTILPKDDRLASPDTIRNRFIGVDIGEYGLMWQLIEIDDSDFDCIQVSALESGFIADPQQKALKERVRDLRERQVRATFTSPDTKIARIRESLIGSYRNQLEDLAIRHNARLSFESEVSNFESGKRRIVVIYDSIKRSSVRRTFNTKRDNRAENIQSWGELKNDKFFWQGLDILAAGTSQTCTQCGRWASLAVRDKTEYELYEWDDGLLKTELSDGEVRLFARKAKVGDKVRGDDGLKDMISEAMRPNIDGVGMEAVRRKLGKKRFGELQEEFGPGTLRGNMALYVCPYIDCGYIADADLQAAFNIAVRGYLVERDGAKGSTKEVLTQKQAELRFDPQGDLG